MGSKISKTGLKPLCSGRKARGKRTRKIQVEPAGSARREAESGREEEAGRASRAETPRVIDLESEDEAEQLCREDSEESCAEEECVRRKSDAVDAKKKKKKKALKKRKEKATTPHKTPEKPKKMVQQMSPKVPKKPMIGGPTASAKKPAKATPREMAKRKMVRKMKKNKIVPWAPPAKTIDNRVAGIQSPAVVGSRCSSTSSYLQSGCDDDNESIAHQGCMSAKTATPSEDSMLFMELSYYNPIQEMRMVLRLMESSDNGEYEDASAMLSVMEKASKEVLRMLLVASTDDQEEEEGEELTEAHCPQPPLEDSLSLIVNDIVMGRHTF